jgi:hypothetical protein
MLADAGISQQEQEQNKQAIVDVMNFYQERDKEDQQNAVFEKMNRITLNEIKEEDEVKPLPEKPVIPSRPAHTMSVYSTDVKKGTLPIHC